MLVLVLGYLANEGSSSYSHAQPDSQLLVGHGSFYWLAMKFGSIIKTSMFLEQVWTAVSSSKTVFKSPSLFFLFIYSMQRDSTP
jgi:hypothetical protein